MMFSEDNLNLDNERMNKLVNANFISIAYVIQKIKIFLLKKFLHNWIWFSFWFFRKRINTTYAGAKRALDPIFESLAFDKELRNINIQFYTLGYMETNLSW